MESLQNMTSPLRPEILVTFDLENVLAYGFPQLIRFYGFSQRIEEN